LLHQQDFVWRRPRPVLGPKDPQRSQRLRKIRALLRDLPADEVAVFQDEADVNTNPKIGSMWMRRGQQTEVVTPGVNTKRYLAGSMNWRTGEVSLSEPASQRNADLFLSHLDELRRRFRRYRRIHVICDNAAFHKPERCKKVQRYMLSGGTALFSISCLPTLPRRTRSNEYGGTSMRKSPVTTAAGISRNCLIWSLNGSQLHLVLTSRLPSTMPPEPHRSLSVSCGAI